MIDEQIEDQTQEIQDGNERLSGVLGSLTSAVTRQTVILQTILDNDIRAREDAERRAAQEDVSGEESAGTGAGGQFDFSQLIPEKKKLVKAGLLALATPFIFEFAKGLFGSLMEGFEDTFTGQSLAVLFKGLTADGGFAAFATGAILGFLRGGVIGAILGATVGVLLAAGLETVSDWIADSDWFSDDQKAKMQDILDQYSNSILGIATGGIVLFFNQILRAMGFLVRKLVQLGAQVLRMIGILPKTPPGGPTAPVPPTGPLDEKEQKRFKKLTPQQLESAGIKETIGKDGQVRYQDMNNKNKFISQRDVLDRADQGLIDRMSKKYPGFAKFMKFGGPLTAIVSGASIASILADDTLTEDERTAALAKEFGGIAGSLIFGTLGTIYGSGLPVIGNIALGAVGSVGGYFGGEYMAEKLLVPMLLNDDPAAIDDSTKMEIENTANALTGVGQGNFESLGLLGDTGVSPYSYTEPAQLAKKSSSMDGMIPLNLEPFDFSANFGNGGGQFNNFQPINNNVRQGDTVVGGSTTEVHIHGNDAKSLKNNVPAVASL